jgi:membrane-associated phospholipid phosphatase
MGAAVRLLLVVAVGTLLIGLAMSQWAYFPGDVAATRWLQAHSPDTSWAALVSQVATVPTKYFVMGLTIGLAYALAGWRGVVLAIAAIAADQYFGEASKSLAARPRPSRDLIAVTGSPSGYTFPSTTMTFFSATFGVLAVVAARTKSNAMRWPLLVVSLLLVVAGGTARVALGAHWPSDVIATVAICLSWIWVAAGVLL